MVHTYIASLVQYGLNTGMIKENTAEILKEEVGKVFAKVLEHAGVYKRDEEGMSALLRFVAHVNS